MYIHIFVSTDDAYVAGYVGVISARVPGRVAQVLVDDNQHVKPGQVLVTLEPQDYEAAVAQAEGNLGRLRQELAQTYVKVSTARTRVPQAEANFKMAGLDKSRYTSLFERRTIPKQTLDQVETRYRVNQAQVTKPSGSSRRPWPPSAGPPTSPWTSSRPSRRPRPNWSRPASTWPIPRSPPRSTATSPGGRWRWATGSSRGSP